MRRMKREKMKRRRRRTGKLISANLFANASYFSHLVIELSS